MQQLQLHSLPEALYFHYIMSFSLSLCQFCCKLFKKVNFKHYIDDIECACAGDETPLPSICILLHSFLLLYNSLEVIFTLKFTIRQPPARTHFVFPHPS